MAAFGVEQLFISKKGNSCCVNVKAFLQNEKTNNLAFTVCGILQVGVFNLCPTCSQIKDPLLKWNMILISILPYLCAGNMLHAKGNNNRMLEIYN